VPAGISRRLASKMLQHFMAGLMGVVFLDASSYANVLV
jgi:hypothetical protein